MSDQSQHHSKYVNNIFSSVSSKYDIMNDIMSFGLHRLWKKKLIKEIDNLNSKIIDMSCGTGDIGLKLYENIKKLHVKPNIILADPNDEMLDIAKNKALNKNILEGIEYLKCTAEKIPLPDNSIDYYVISFGMRNIDNKEIALKEAFRILKKGGKFICLEFAKINPIQLQQIYKLYSQYIIPKIGKYIANNEEAYQYLVDSIEKFPDQQTFKGMIFDAGFQNIDYTNLTFGTTAIHTGYK